MPEGLRCRHFGACGGCSLQDLSDDAYAEAKRRQIVRALSRHNVHADVHQTVRVPPRSRRRAVFKAKKSRGAVELGFHAASSHSIVDMQECLVLTPTLLETSGRLRRILTEILAEGSTAELHATDTDVGVDLAIRWSRKATPALIAALSAWAAESGVTRVTANGDIVVSLAAPTVRFADVEVQLPPGSFLQPTIVGEQIMQDIVRHALGDAKSVADLFSGCGTFALALAHTSRVQAVDADSTMLSALSHAAKRASGLKPVSVEKRDLHRRPLSKRELASFDGAVLDPPRAGAERQARELAQAGVPRIAYVSCNAETFARDARVLCDGGLHLQAVTPIDQFLWSDHIELVGVFERRSR